MPATPCTRWTSRNSGIRCARRSATSAILCRREFKGRFSTMSSAPPSATSTPSPAMVSTTPCSRITPTASRSSCNGSRMWARSNCSGCRTKRSGSNSPTSNSPPWACRWRRCNRRLKNRMRCPPPASSKPPASDCSYGSRGIFRRSMRSRTSRFASAIVHSAFPM
ncbi:hypothetical protein D3C87_1467670 [compost metagenome]